MTPTPLGKDDVPALKAFFERVPEGDRTFFREDVANDGVIEGWLASETDRRYLARDGDDVVGYLALIPEVGWSAHVAEVRVVVDPSRRRQGIGRDLARHGLIEAVQMGYTKLIVEVVADQEPTLEMFSKLGFGAEALLRDHVRDDRGELHDLIVMSHFAEENWSAMQAMGMEVDMDVR
jgi:ribosomal protein S18 acetylase RimI-like enzyme